jgi:hypothetical protein
VEGVRKELPFTVMVAAFLGFAKAAFLGLMGVIGLAAWDDVSDPWGYGSLALAVVLAVASYLLVRGKPIARTVVAALAVIGGIGALVYAFTGPRSTLLASLATMLFAVLLIWLLYGPRPSREYFET